jgi:hypothetical protein
VELVTISESPDCKIANEFDKLLLNALDNSLKEVFTENGASMIYAYLKSDCAIDQEEIPQKLDLFVDGLHRFLSTGAYPVERVILENLCSNLHVKYRLDEEQDFKNSIVQLKSCLKLR